jgi:hypothetical protein
MATGPATRDPDELGRALVRIDRVSSAGLTRWIGGLEEAFAGASGSGVADALGKNGIDDELLTAALLVKRSAGQINVLVHAVGILVALPEILEAGEVVESLSLGAGNTGQAHDLETDRRIAEFTFIDWRGGPESIRQNKLFGDVVALVGAQTSKRRVLYVNGKDIPLSFLQNRRALSSVLKDAPLERRFRALYGNRFTTVQDYWLAVRDRVEIVDLAGVIPALAPSS